MSDAHPTPDPRAAVDLSDLKLVDQADVYKGTELAAHLSRGPDGIVTFAYTSQWLSNGGDPVASTLPLTSDPVVVPGGGVPAYFAGLLPEGRRLSALRNSVKTSPDDELSLLLGVGGDTVGDVRVLPSGASLERVQPGLQVSSFSQVRFSDLLERVGIHVDRVGLPGVQDKVSMRMLNVPVTSAGSHWLLKLNPPEFTHIVENERFFLAASTAAGLRPVEAQLVHDVDGDSGLVVTRFDRVTRGDSVVFLPVEDGCQVLGLPPAAKYRVTTEDVIRALSGLCEAPRPAAADFFTQFAYAYVMGNGDAHAKNFSVLRDVHDRWQPTPVYDIPNSTLYGDHTTALSIDGRRDTNIPAKHFVALGTAVGLPERAVRKTLKRVADSADEWVDDLAGRPFDGGKLQKLKRTVRNRQRMLRTAP